MTELSSENDCLRSQLEALSNRLYHLEHRARFIADLAGAASPGKQADALLAESVQVVFYEFGDELKAVGNGLADLSSLLPFVSRSES